MAYAQNPFLAGLQGISNSLQNTRPAAVQTQSIAMWSPSTPHMSFHREQQMYLPHQNSDIEEADLTDEKIEFIEQILLFLRGFIDEPVYPGLDDYFGSNEEEVEYTAFESLQESLEALLEDSADVNGDEQESFAGYGRATSPLRASIGPTYTNIIPNLLDLAGRIPVRRQDPVRAFRYTMDGNSLSFLMQGRTCQAAWGHFRAVLVEFDVLLRLIPGGNGSDGMPARERHYELLILTTPLYG